MAFSLAVVILLGLGADFLFRRIRLPGLVGMLLVGVLAGPFALNLLHPEMMDVSADFRKIALIVILLRAGFELQRETLHRVGRAALLMSVVPALFEIGGVLLVAPRWLSIGYLDAAILGAILAAVSPAVVVPLMIDFMDRGRGIKQGIPTLVLAASSIDDVFVIVLFTIFLGMHGGGDVNVWTRLAEIPVSIFTGIGLGLAAGYALYRLFVRYDWRPPKRTLTVVGVAILLTWVEAVCERWFPIASLLGVMAVGFVILEKAEPIAHLISQKLKKLWVFAELLLFVLVGAQVNVHVAWKAGLAGSAVILVGLLFRSAGTYLSLAGTPFTRGEKLFCVVSYLPKATVQAAIGAVPLAAGIPSGEVILAVAVLSILLTAPVGAIGIKFLGERVLDRGSRSPYRFRDLRERLSLPRVGERVRNRHSGTVWKIIEERERWIPGGFETPDGAGGRRTRAGTRERRSQGRTRPLPVPLPVVEHLPLVLERSVHRAVARLQGSPPSRPRGRVLLPVPEEDRREHPPVALRLPCRVARAGDPAFRTSPGSWKPFLFARFPARLFRGLRGGRKTARKTRGAAREAPGSSRRSSPPFPKPAVRPVTLLRELGEFGFLDHLQRSFPAAGPHVVRGIGDDCAVVTVPDGEKALWTVDTLVEGVHFRTDCTDLYSLGWKSLAVNLSDVAAMGGRPLHAVLSLGVSPDTSLEALEAFYAGFADLARDHEVSLVGGDMVRSLSGILITVSVLGASCGGRFLTRDGARPGDWIVLTGTPGDSAAGLAELLDPRKGGGADGPGTAAAEALIRAHIRPRPQVREGLFLAECPEVHAAIDTSDGLAQDLWHVCRNSGVGACLEQDRIPLSSGLRQRADLRGEDPWAWALFGGEDYHLLATVRQGALREVRVRYESRLGKPLHPIGRITRKGGILLETSGGERRPLEPVGYDHFRARTSSRERR